MDMTNLTIASLTLGGNVVFFWGFFKLLSLTVFKKNREVKESDIEEETDKEIKRIERELRRM